MSLVPVPSKKRLADIPGPALLYVNAKWCGHCKNTRPVMQDVAQMLGSVVPVFDVDSDTNGALISELGVEGFPTIIYKKGSKLKTFESSRTADAIQGFVCDQDSSPGFCATRRR